MNARAIISVIPLIVLFSGLPAAGHDCGYYDHHHGDCWDCDHQHQGRPWSRQGWDSQGTVAAVRTVEGKIVEVIYLPGAATDTGMVEIRVQSSGLTKLIRLAPSGFLKQGGLSLREGDAVSLTGFAVTGMDGDLIVATEIRSGDRVLPLRDTRGRPAW
jgi:hypothetical protein